MEKPLLFRLPYRVESGHRQMTVDLALLQWAAGGPERAAFRTYGWSRPTLSLGRAEPFPGAWDLEALEREGIDVVRRPTGGSGVLHDEEMTFAAAASLPGPWELGPREFADLVAESLSEALRQCGLPAERIAADQAAAGPPRGSTVACFARSDRGEVRVGAFKVAGIASRFTRGAALSHASVPLSPRHRDVALFRRDGGRDRVAVEEHARSAPELLRGEIDPNLLAVRLAASLARRLELEPREATFAEIGLNEPDRPSTRVSPRSGRASGGKVTA